MRKISTLLFSLLLLSVTGCEDKKPDQSSIAIENTTEFVSNTKENQAPHDTEKTDSFMLLNTKSKSYKVSLSENTIIFPHNKKDIILVNLFATWCPPCLGQLSYFNTLQKKHSENLLLIGILTHDTIDMPALKSFIATHEIKYFISNSPHNNAFSTKIANILQLSENFSIPLTVMYVKGKYFTHYEGTVPIEMIEYDIKQAEKKLKSNKE